jgi:hypothetical protein
MLLCCAGLCCVLCVVPAEGTIDEAMAEVLDEEFPPEPNPAFAGAGGAGFVV